MEASITFMDTVYFVDGKNELPVVEVSYGTFRVRLSPVLIPFVRLKLELNYDTNRYIAPINLS